MSSLSYLPIADQFGSLTEPVYNIVIPIYGEAPQKDQFLALANIPETVFCIARNEKRVSWLAVIINTLDLHYAVAL